MPPAVDSGKVVEKATASLSKMVSPQNIVDISRTAIELAYPGIGGQIASTLTAKLTDYLLATEKAPDGSYDLDVIKNELPSLIANTLSDMQRPIREEGMTTAGIFFNNKIGSIISICAVSAYLMICIIFLTLHVNAPQVDGRRVVLSITVGVVILIFAFVISLNTIWTDPNSERLIGSIYASQFRIDNRSTAYHAAFLFCIFLYYSIVSYLWISLTLLYRRLDFLSIVRRLSFLPWSDTVGDAVHKIFESEILDNVIKTMIKVAIKEIGK